MEKQVCSMEEQVCAMYYERVGEGLTTVQALYHVANSFDMYEEDVLDCLGF